MYFFLGYFSVIAVFLGVHKKPKKHKKDKDKA
jgi:hypothetical protein